MQNVKVIKRLIMHRRRVTKRGNCEFNGCLCVKHKRLKGTERCRICNHGTCWHKMLYYKKTDFNIDQFISTRPNARTPNYKVVKVFIPISLEEHLTNASVNYCKTIDKLPA